MKPFAAVASLAASLTLSLAAQDTPVLVQNVRVFDGEKVLAADSVRFEGGRITAIGRKLPVKGARTVDGTGQTLMPGLVDSHIHTFGPALRQALTFGVTTVVDCFTDPKLVREAKARASRQEADLVSSGHLATAPKGHGTEFGVQVPTLTRPEEATPWVQARVSEGSDFIKLVVDNGKAYRLDFPTLDMPVVRALAQAARAAGKLSVAHVATEDTARQVLEAGVNGLAHPWGDQGAPSPATLALLKQKGRFVMTTLSVFQAGAPAPLGRSLAEDPALKPYLSHDMEQGLRQQLPWQVASRAYIGHATAAVTALHQAGVTLLAGTDAPNPGTAQGVSLHGELELLVKAGLSPLEALKAATAAPAQVFQLQDRGRIRTGARADLLLVQGDPTRDILATRAIVQVWKQGEAFDRAQVAREVQAGREAAARPSTAQAPTRWTSPQALAAWTPTTDAMAGGASTVKVQILPEGLHLTGQVDGKLPFAWAGVMWMPTGDFQKGLDFRGLKSLKFRATGQGRARLMLYTLAGGFMPQEKAFAVSPEGVDVEVPFSAFKGDLSKVNALILAAGPTPGPVDLKIQDLRVE